MARMVQQYCLFSLRLLWVGMLLLCQNGNSAVAKMPTELRVAVIFPQLQAPYDQIFKTITDGIDLAHQGPIQRLEISASLAATEFSKILAKENPDAVIALGTRSIDLLLQTHYPLDRAIAGAVLIDTDDSKKLSGISIAPDPAQMFAHLKKLAPSITAIKVIYHRAEEQHLIDAAAMAAKKADIDLTAIPADSLPELAEAYKQQLKKLDAKSEALWIPHTGNSLDAVIMGRVLREAWNRQLVVFSSNLADVRKGVLFALFPDNRALGQRLVELLYERAETMETSRSVALSSDLLSAINNRTANHLGIYLSPADLANYQLVYPEGK